MLTSLLDWSPFRDSNALAFDSLRMSPLLMTYNLLIYLSKSRFSMRRSISAVCPPEPRTMTSFAEDLARGGSCVRKMGRIHRRRARHNETTDKTITKESVIKEARAMVIYRYWSREIENPSSVWREQRYDFQMVISPTWIERFSSTWIGVFKYLPLPGI